MWLTIMVLSKDLNANFCCDVAAVGEEKLMRRGFSAEGSQTFLHPADISAATDLGCVSAPMSWRIWECAPALLERISISPLPYFFPSAVFPLMSRRSSDMLTRTFMLTQFSPTLENILLPAAAAHEDFFIFTVSVYNRSEACAALLNSWTPVYITNEPLDCYTVIC